LRRLVVSYRAFEPGQCGGVISVMPCFRASGVHLEKSYGFVVATICDGSEEKVVTAL
jgi:hypothetical protein